jgi:hypothetical protein
MLTLIVYRARKPGLLFDMSVIAAIQLTALLYGVHVVYQERPYFVVHALDRFEVVASKDVDFDSIKDPQMRQKPWVGPIYVVATRPENTTEAQKLLEEVLFEGKPDIERRPALWKRYAKNTGTVVKSGHELDLLTDYYPGAQVLVDKALAAAGRTKENLRFIPIMGKKDDFAMLIDAGSAEPVGLLELDPWPALAHAARAAGETGHSEGETVQPK